MGHTLSCDGVDTCSCNGWTWSSSGWVYIVLYGGWTHCLVMGGPHCLAMGWPHCLVAGGSHCPVVGGTHGLAVGGGIVLHFVGHLDLR